MNVVATRHPDVLILEPRVFGDDRGFFFEAFNERVFADVTGLHRSWVQDNHSRSQRGVLRGLHFQNPHPQGKLVRCVLGAVFDVAVDVRRSSPQFGTWVATELDEESKRMMWVPEGFAHGFLVLSDAADLLYKATDYFSTEADRGVRWNDPEIGIPWPLSDTPRLSTKDAAAPLLSAADTYD